MRYTHEQISEMARIVMTDHLEGGMQSIHLILTVAILAELDPDQVWQRIQELSNG